jgi:hypothetical protein
MAKRTFIKFDIGEFYEKFLSQFTFHLNRTRLITTLYEDLYVFLRVCRWKFVREKCFERKLQRKMNRTFYVLYIVSVTLTNFNIFKQKGCYKYKLGY